MYTHPYIRAQLIRENQRDRLARASQRQLRDQLRRPSAGIPSAARIGRRLAAAIARAKVVVAHAPGAIWPYEPHPLAEPTGLTSTDGVHTDL